MDSTINSVKDCYQQFNRVPFCTNQGVCDAIHTARENQNLLITVVTDIQGKREKTTKFLTELNSNDEFLDVISHSYPKPTILLIDRDSSHGRQLLRVLPQLAPPCIIVSDPCVCDPPLAIVSSSAVPALPRHYRAAHAALVERHIRDHCQVDLRSPGAVDEQDLSPTSSVAAAGPPASLLEGPGSPLSGTAGPELGRNRTAHGPTELDRILARAHAEDGPGATCRAPVPSPSPASAPAPASLAAGVAGLRLAALPAAQVAEQPAEDASPALEPAPLLTAASISAVEGRRASERERASRERPLSPPLPSTRVPVDLNNVWGQRADSPLESPGEVVVDDFGDAMSEEERILRHYRLRGPGLGSEGKGRRGQGTRAEEHICASGSEQERPSPARESPALRRPELVARLSGRVKPHSSRFPVVEAAANAEPAAGTREGAKAEAEAGAEAGSGSDSGEGSESYELVEEAEAEEDQGIFGWLFGGKKKQ